MPLNPTILLFDGHCDTAYELWRRREPLLNNTCHVNLKKASAFRAYAQVFAFCSYEGQRDEAYSASDYLTEPLRVLQEELRKNRQYAGFAKNAEEISALNLAGKTAVLLSVEGPEMIDCNPERLPKLREQGFVMSTLTWNASNALAGTHTTQKGLTSRGRAYVAAAQELGILIDVSHLSECAFWNLLDVTAQPILASHSNCAALCPHTRNLTDDQLRQIAQTGGTVGLNLYPPFVGGSTDFEMLRQHLEHMLHLCGERHVALGGDLDGCDMLVSGFNGLSDYADFYAYLRSCGYGEELLAQIFYRNLLRLF